VVSAKTIKAFEAYMAAKGKPVAKVDVYRGVWWPHTETVQFGEETEAPASSETSERRSS
jgi:hypothetical protein